MIGGVQVQDIGNTQRQIPWKKSEPMEQRIELALKSGSFWALCQEYGTGPYRSSERQF
jgi:hypothetical protein